MSKSFNDNFKFMSKEQWAKKKLKVPFIPYKGHELEWHYCAKFCQHLVNIYRMFDLDKKFKTNSKEDLKNSNFGLFAGWITTFKMFLSVPVVRNVWEQYKYCMGNPELSAWVKYFITDPLEKDPKFFSKHRNYWDKEITKILSAQNK